MATPQKEGRTQRDEAFSPTLTNEVARLSELNIRSPPPRELSRDNKDNSEAEIFANGNGIGIGIGNPMANSVNPRRQTQPHPVDPMFKENIIFRSLPMVVKKPPVNCPPIPPPAPPSQAFHCFDEECNEMHFSTEQDSLVDESHIDEEMSEATQPNFPPYPHLTLDKDRDEKPEQITFLNALEPKRDPMHLRSRFSASYTNVGEHNSEEHNFSIFTQSITSPKTPDNPFHTNQMTPNQPPQTPKAEATAKSDQYPRRQMDGKRNLSGLPKTIAANVHEDSDGPASKRRKPSKMSLPLALTMNSPQTDNVRRRKPANPRSQTALFGRKSADYTSCVGMPNTARPYSSEIRKPTTVLSPESRLTASANDDCVPPDETSSMPTVFPDFSSRKISRTQSSLPALTSHDSPSLRNRPLRERSLDDRLLRDHIPISAPRLADLYPREEGEEDVRKELSLSASSGEAPDTNYTSQILLPFIRAEKGISINVETLCQVLTGKYKQHYDRLTLVDCRYDYEYTGGHIEGAINLQDNDVDDYFFARYRRLRHLVIFYCEFSSQRGPACYHAVRDFDRKYNPYPGLYYPEIYLLQGGYSNFFKETNGKFCDPPRYVRMDDPEHKLRLKEMTAKKRQSKAKGRGKMAEGRLSPTNS